MIIQDHRWHESPGELTDDLPLIENHVLNSLALLRLVSRIEDDFEIEVRDEDVVISNFRTIGQIAAFIDERRSGHRRWRR